jgi:hypothetical protein
MMKRSLFSTLAIGRIPAYPNCETRRRQIAKV